MRGEGNVYPYGRGELIVLLDGVSQEYKHIDEQIDTIYKNHIQWESISPYKLYILTMDGERVEEDYNSKRIVELRVLQLLKDKSIRSLQVYNTLDNTDLQFTVNKVEYSSANPTMNGDLSISWWSNWGIGEDDEDF